MKQLLKIALLMGICATAWAQVHPGFTLATIHPSSWSPRVGGMDLLSDGRLVVAEWGVPHSVFIVDNPGTATGNSIQVSEFAKGLDNVLGLKVVNDRIFVLQRQELTELIDTDNDGEADEYVNINDAFPTHEAMLQFAYDLDYTRGAFWAALSADVIVGGYTWGCQTQSYCNGRAPVAGRSTMWKLNWDGTSEEWAGGFRNPNGMGVGLGSEIFVTDNQGSWLPSSKVIHVKQGHFYGHRTNPQNTFQSAGETPPLAWLTHSEISLSPGKVIYLNHGRFQGQLLVTETVNSRGGDMYRIFMEEVNGDIQGVVMPFVKSGMEGGTQRLVQASDGTLYVGIHGSSGGWNQRSGMTPGLQRLRDNGANVFELLAVQSLSSIQFELEFTQPLSATGDQTGNYNVEDYEMNPEEGYGAGSRQNVRNLNVQSVSVSSDRLRATLTISGLREGNVVHFDIGSLRAQGGNSAPFTDDAWYTLNQFGPGSAPTQTPVVQPSLLSENWTVRRIADGFQILFSELTGLKSLNVYDLKGTLVSQMSTEKNSIEWNTRELEKGLYLLRAAVGGKVLNRKILIR